MASLVSAHCRSDEHCIEFRPEEDSVRRHWPFEQKMASTQYGIPLIVGNFVDTAARGVTRIRFQKGVDDGMNYNEKWLQKLISRYPNVLPIEQIERALTPAVPICMELPLASGFVDNLYATPDGDLIVAETKLFRNPEARREVVG